MLFDLFDSVIIRKSGTMGTIVDIYNSTDGRTVYTVQCDTAIDDADAYPGEQPLVDCTADALKKN